MKRISRGAWPCVFLLIACGCGSPEQQVEEPIRPVRFERAFSTGGTRVRTFSGTAQAGAESGLSFKVSGTIATMKVNVGDLVGRGSLIAKLDDSDYRLRVKEAEAALAQARAQHRNAESNYARTEALWENASAAKQDLDAARASFESTAAQVQSIENRLELARLQLDYTTLLAPFEGGISELRVQENENVAPGTVVAILTSSGRTEVQVAVPEVLIAQVKAGDAATVTFDATGDRPFAAVVTEVGVSSTGFATTFPVLVQLEQDSPEVRPGMAAEVAFRFETAGTREAVIVPPVAVGEDHRGRFVFTLEQAEDGFAVARRTVVTVGDLTGEGLEILGGLQEGELVITAGISRIQDGQKVRLP